MPVRGRKSQGRHDDPTQNPAAARRRRADDRLHEEQFRDRGSPNLSPAAVAADPDPVDPHAAVTAATHFAAGQLAESGGDTQRAVQQYRAALQIDPQHSLSLLHLALIYTAQKQYPTAIDLWHQYVSATHDSAAAYNDLGLCLEMANQPGDAEMAYLAGITHEPGNPACHVNYGLMLARHNRLDEAANQLGAVLTPAEVHYDLASVLESEKKTKQARDEYQQAIALDPDMNDAKTRLAALDTN